MFKMGIVILEATTQMGEAAHSLPEGPVSILLIVDMW